MADYSNVLLTRKHVCIINLHVLEVAFLSNLKWTLRTSMVESTHALYLELKNTPIGAINGTFFTNYVLAHNFRFVKLLY